MVMGSTPSRASLHVSSRDDSRKVGPTPGRSKPFPPRTIEAPHAPLATTQEIGSGNSTVNVHRPEL
jgi:hypothetical protein